MGKSQPMMMALTPMTKAKTNCSIYENRNSGHFQLGTTTFIRMTLSRMTLYCQEGLTSKKELVPMLLSFSRSNQATFGVTWVKIQENTLLKAPLPQAIWPDGP